MKSVWTSIAAAFSTFSILPMPRVGWAAYSLRNVLSALPLVCNTTRKSVVQEKLVSPGRRRTVILSAVVFTILPITLSGGIHMDGFADVVDALSSHAEPEKKRAILKDPHCGAFAVIGVCCYVLMFFGLCAALPLDWKTVGLFGITHVLSRAGGSLLSLLPSASQGGMQRAFRDSASKSSVWVLTVWIVLSLAGAALLSPLAAGMMLLACVCVFFHVRRTAAKQFGGMSGDLAGYGISLSSIAMLLMLVLSERAAALWF